MLVAIIDTGIQPGIIPTGPIIYDMEATHFGVVRKRKGEVFSFHGTLVAAILEKYAPGCNLCSIKIFEDKTQMTTCKMFCAALRWCKQMNVPIINVSAGSVETRDFKRIVKFIDSLWENGQTLIAAYNINGSPTMPAGHRSVIGVKTSPFLYSAAYMPDNSSAKQDYVASSQHVLQLFSGRVVTTSISTSFAVPTVTAAIVNSRRYTDGLE